MSDLNFNDEWGYMCQRALRYLSRFPSSEGRFRAVMRQAVTKKLGISHRDENRSLDLFIDRLVEYVSQLGYLDDDRFASGLVVSYRRRGDSKRLIVQKLRRKGLTFAAIEAAMNGENQDSELEAAKQFIVKKKLTTHWSTADSTDRRRIFERLARRGFSYGVARAAIESLTNG